MIHMPKSPDPYATAAAQTGQNIMSSIGSSIVGNANEITPYGNVTYSNAGWETVTDPGTGRTYQVPRYNRTTTLSPEQQGLLNLQNAAAKNLGNLAVQQSSALQGLLKKPLDTKGLQDWTALPNWNEGEFSADRGRVEKALMGRWQDINAPQWAGREATLAGRGLTPGAAGYDQAAAEYERARNDATYGAIQAGGQEQSRLLGEMTNRANFNNTLRGQQFGERQTLQAFPVNLITALMSGSQVNVPQAAPYKSTAIQPADIEGDIWRKYQADSQRSMAMNQGLFGLAGSIVGLPWARA